MTLGELIKNARKYEELSQKELGDLLGVTSQMVSKWENTATLDNMQISTLYKISNALELNILDFLYVETITHIIMIALDYACYDDDIKTMFVEYVFEDDELFQLFDIWIRYDDDTEQYNTQSLLYCYQNSLLYEGEKGCHDALIKILSNNPIIESKVCEKLQEYTLQHDLKQILVNSDKDSQSEYLVNLVQKNCKPAVSNPRYNLPLMSSIRYATNPTMRNISDDVLEDNKKFKKVFQSLNDKGQEKLLEQARLLAKIPEYQADKPKKNTSMDDSGDTADNDEF